MPDRKRTDGDGRRKGGTTRGWEGRAEELDHDYLWRYARRLPARGEIGIFNRSHSDSGFTVVKLFLNLSKEEQRIRPQYPTVSPDTRGQLLTAKRELEAEAPKGAAPDRYAAAHATAEEGASDTAGNKDRRSRSRTKDKTTKVNPKAKGTRASPTRPARSRWEA